MASPQLEMTDGGMYAATIHVRHNCPIGNLSRKLPSLRVVQWCVGNRDLFQVSGPKDQVQAFREWAEEGTEVRHVSSAPDGLLIVTTVCRCGVSPESSIGETIRRAGAWDIPPIVYREGWESWRLLVFGDRSLRELFRDLRQRGELQIASLKPIENVSMEKMMLVPAADLFGGLTDRQSSALLLGMRHGYYATPSATNIDRLAQGVGLSASTFSEHMRKAEARILLSLRPHLEAYATRSPGEVAVEDVRAVAGRRRALTAQSPEA
ncbi:MAG TPA: helix-turn-helix domain-containing protein [Thermoplasmata archaeon]|nr:helix-turn-helix domain-containing protein [Thermoplasmata archaeon]